jgi:D-alanine-D-alanine ligase
MKLLILHNPLPERRHLSDRRFAKMAAMLLDAGIYAKPVIIQTVSDLTATIDRECPDIVYSAAYYIVGDQKENIVVNSILAVKNIPFIGSEKANLELVLSKGKLKRLWEKNNVPTPAFLQVTSKNIADVKDQLDSLNDYPYLLKPNLEGNSRGLDEDSIVYDHSTMLMKLEELLPTYNEILIEKFLGDNPDLREFTVGMIGSSERMILMPAEIIMKTPKVHRIITTTDKDEHRTTALPVKDKVLREKLKTFASQAISVTGVRDYARCDILLAGEKMFAIEINGLPMIPDKWFEVCAAGEGLNERQYIAAIVMAGVLRNMQHPGSRLCLTKRMINSLPESFWKAMCETQMVDVDE